jgi:hypothetical protein
MFRFGLPAQAVEIKDDGINSSTIISPEASYQFHLVRIANV